MHYHTCICQVRYFVLIQLSGGNMFCVFTLVLEITQTNILQLIAFSKLLIFNVESVMSYTRD